jgi:hypothetical protein
MNINTQTSEHRAGARRNLHIRPSRAGLRLLAGGVVATATLAVAAPAVGAEPNEKASCAAKLTVFNTEYPEVFGTRADVAHQLKADASAIGVSPGHFVSTIATRSTPLEDCI